jgi:hypothetical protein
MDICCKQDFGQCAYRHSPSQLNARIGREIENRRDDLARPCDAPHRRVGIDLGAGGDGMAINSQRTGYSSTCFTFGYDRGFRNAKRE